MNREERIKAVLNRGEPDRIPVSVWMHFSEDDQDPRSLAETMVAFNEKYDYDFIKMMPAGFYTTPDWGARVKIYCDRNREAVITAPAISALEDYKKVDELPAVYGSWGKTLQITQHVSRLIRPDTPYLQTLFSPLTTLRKMTSSRLLSDMLEHPYEIHQALASITATNINFIKANIEAGVSGFFFATQCATYDYLTDELFFRFCRPYDLQVIDAFRDKTWFNVIHIHGDHIMFDAVAEYPCNVINWHDRHSPPSLKAAREMTDKVLLGGICEVPTIMNGVLHYDSVLEKSSAPEVRTHVREAIDMVDGKGIIIGPGCVASPRTSEENLRAVREAVEWIS